MVVHRPLFLGVFALALVVGPVARAQRDGPDEPDDPDEPDLTNLWLYVEHLTQTLGHIDGEGHCQVSF